MTPLLRLRSAWDNRTVSTFHLDKQLRHLLHTSLTAGESLKSSYKAPYSCGKCSKETSFIPLGQPGGRKDPTAPWQTVPQRRWPRPSHPKQLSETTHWNTKLKPLTLETFHHLSWHHRLLCSGCKVYENKTQRNDPGVMAKWPHTDTWTQALVLRLRPAHFSGWSSGVSQELSVPQSHAASALHGARDPGDFIKAHRKNWTLHNQAFTIPESAASVMIISSKEANPSMQLQSDSPYGWARTLSPQP